MHLVMAELLKVDKDSYWRAVAKHASLALFVAGLLILVVDIHTKRETRNEAERYRSQTKQEVEEYTKGVAENVWKAVASRIVPDEICKEIDSVLKSPVLKDDCRYTITIGIPYEGIEEDEIVVRRTLRFFAKNLTGIEPTTYPMKAHIKNPLDDREVKLDGIDYILPRHVECQVGQQTISVEENLNAEDRRLFEYDVAVPKEGGILISLVFDEICEISETNVYTTGTPMKDLTVMVINNAKEKVEIKETRLHHPREADFVRVQDNLWVFKGGVLPGQAFSVSWGPSNQG